MYELIYNIETITMIIKIIPILKDKHISQKIIIKLTISKIVKYMIIKK